MPKRGANLHLVRIRSPPALAAPYGKAHGTWLEVMACCGGGGNKRQAPVIEEEEKPPKDPLRYDAEDAKQEADRMQLDDILFDEFGAAYLLRFSQSEFSSENTAFLIAMKALLRLPKGDAQLSSVALQIAETHLKVGTAARWPAPRASAATVALIDALAA